MIKSEEQAMLPRKKVCTGDQKQIKVTASQGVK